MCATMILIAAVDVSFQLYDYSKKLKMTLQEVKDEMKQAEGDPKVKKRRLRMQQQIAMQRIAAAWLGG